MQLTSQPDTRRTLSDASFAPSNHFASGPTTDSSYQSQCAQADEIRAAMSASQCQQQENATSPPQAQDQLRSPQRLGLLQGATLGDLHEYVQAHPDWDSGHDAASTAPLSNWVQFAEESPAHLSACGDMLVRELVDAGPIAAAPLSRYAHAVRGDSVGPSLRPTDDVERAVTWGRALQTLEMGIEPIVLQQIVTHGQFVRLVDGGWVKDFVDYVRTYNPILHASHGREIESYCKLREEQFDPMELDPASLWTLGSPHRFSKVVLETLVERLSGGQDSEPRKPLVLYLQSALDHNGAFHRVPRPGSRGPDSEPRIVHARRRGGHDAR